MPQTNTSARVYCTYFDRGYLARGMTLFASLREHGDQSDIWVLCLDEPSKRYLDASAINGLHTITVADLEGFEPQLAPLKASRSRMEYTFTGTPHLVRFVMDQTPAADDAVVVYLDADLYFFDDPGLVFDALGAGSVGIIEHKYPASLATRLGKYGRFNVGWVGFRSDANGRACLQWWGSRTIDWCFDRPEDGKYADQGYLDEFPGRFDGVVVLEGMGLNLAPWNTARHTLAAAQGSQVVVDGVDPLVFFHFHGIRRLRSWYVTSQLVYGARLGPVLRDRIYLPYLRRLEAAEVRLAVALGTGTSIRKRGNGWRGLVSRLRKVIIDRVTILTGNAISLRKLLG